MISISDANGAQVRAREGAERGAGAPASDRAGVWGGAPQKKDEPIVCTPEDAYRCFMKTNMDVLVMEDFVFVKPAVAETASPAAAAVGA